MIKNISNLGDAAVYCDFGVEVNKSVNSEVIKYFKALKKENVESINVEFTDEMMERVNEIHNSNPNPSP